MASHCDLVIYITACVSLEGEQERFAVLGKINQVGVTITLFRG